MQITIDLGKELGGYANSITNVFTTKDYVGELQDSYKSHVKSFYIKDEGDFRKIYSLLKIVYDKDFKPTPCDTPLDDILDAKKALQNIVKHKGAYASVIGILMDTCKDTGDAGNLIHDLLSVLKSSSNDFHETAIKYDRYMGNDLSVAQVILAVRAYGNLSGLVDYYNFEEGKDG